MPPWAVDDRSRPCQRLEGPDVPWLRKKSLRGVPAGCPRAGIPRARGPQGRQVPPSRAARSPRTLRMTRLMADARHTRGGLRIRLDYSAEGTRPTAPRRRRHEHIDAAVPDLERWAPRSSPGAMDRADAGALSGPRAADDQAA